MQAEKDSTQLADTKWIGKPVDRVDGRAKVTGAARYAGDVTVEKIAHASAFQTTIAKGRVKKIDTSSAEKSPGVLSVMTSKNTPKVHAVSMDHNPGRPGQTWLPMQDDTVHYAGQYLGLVIAETLEQAQHAASLIQVQYDEQQPTTELSAVLDLAFKPKKVGLGDSPDVSRGDAEKALDNAAIKSDRSYSTSTQNHNPMETSTAIAAWNGERLTLYDATQWVLGVQSVVATWLGIDNEKFVLSIRM